MDGNSVLVGKSLTKAATPECLDVLSSPSELADETGERRLGSSLRMGGGACASTHTTRRAA